MPRDEFTAEAFFKGFAEGWRAGGGADAVSQCPPPEPHFDGVEYLIDQVRAKDGLPRVAQCKRGEASLVKGSHGALSQQKLECDRSSIVTTPRPARTRTQGWVGISGERLGARHW